MILIIFRHIVINMFMHTYNVTNVKIEVLNAFDNKRSVLSQVVKSKLL